MSILVLLYVSLFVCFEKKIPKTPRTQSDRRWCRVGHFLVGERGFGLGFKFYNLAEMPDRNYKWKYMLYYGDPENPTSEQARHRKEKTARNRTRRLMKRKTRVGPNQDIDHKNGNPLDNRLSNLQVVSASFNRSKK